MGHVRQVHQMTAASQSAPRNRVAAPAPASPNPDRIAFLGAADGETGAGEPIVVQALCWPTVPEAWIGLNQAWRTLRIGRGNPSPYTPLPRAPLHGSGNAPLSWRSLSRVPPRRRKARSPRCWPERRCRSRFRSMAWDALQARQARARCRIAWLPTTGICAVHCAAHARCWYAAASPRKRIGCI
ncbi:hypothetical protein [Lysobacter gummosus]|uniref:hypothetical protein n=1 Tax=Lysobacter gummosus TaxID=262324 RepID=UPI0036369AD8